MSSSDFSIFTYTVLRDKAIKKRKLLSPSNISLLENPDSLSKNNLLLMGSDLKDKDLKNYANALLLAALTVPPLDQSESLTCSEIIFELISSIPDQKSSILSKFSSNFTSLTSDARVKDLEKWLFFILRLEAQKCNIEAPKQWLKCQYLKYVYSEIARIRTDLKAEDIKNLISLVEKLQNLGIQLENLRNLIFATAVEYLISKYDLHGINNSLGIAEAQVDQIEISSIMGNVQRLTNIDQKNLRNFRLLEEKFGEFPKYKEIDLDSPKKAKKEIPIENLIESGIDLNSVIWEADQTYYKKMGEFIVDIYIGTLPDGKLIARKTYKTTNLEDQKSIQNEIQIMTLLSNRSLPTNCFLKFYGAKFEGDGKIALYMEAHRKDLMAYISELKNDKRRISNSALETLISQLIKSFAEMESIGINHKDIKPHNMLVVDESNVKIIDFSVSEKIKTLEVTMSPTGVQRIQGTVGYMAPELQEMHSKGNSTGLYKPGRADVFSLGLTLFQLITLEDTNTLNFKSENSRLLRMVEEINMSQWVKALLTNMLNSDYKKRFSFKKCIQYLKSSEEEHTIFN